MDHAFLVRMLNSVADIDEQLEPLSNRQAVLIAVVRQLDTTHQLHREVGAAVLGGAGVQDLGDIGMLHHRECLPLGLEAGQDLLGVHAGLEDLQRDSAPHRLDLLGLVDDAHAAFAEHLENAVRADALRVVGWRESGMVCRWYVGEFVVFGHEDLARGRPIRLGRRPRDLSWVPRWGRRPEMSRLESGLTPSRPRVTR